MRPKVYPSILKFASVVLVFFFATSFMLAQRTITGNITDADNGDPLIGANVFVKNTTRGAITDFNGDFSLEVEADDKALVVSYTGYSDQEVEIGASDVVNVQMTSGELLDEIVVVGYGTVKKRDLTGAVTQVKAEDFIGGIVTAPNQLIQGKVAGVQILSNNGAPGADATVRIRGNSSVRTGNNPLYVVDGVPLDGRSSRPGISDFGGGDGLGSSPSSNPLNFINPADIASMEVLKDASATAIYGSRGSNGVILITTKRGRSGAPSLSANASVAVSNIARQPNILDGNGYRQALTEYGLMGDFGGNEDAFDAIFRTAITQDYGISISGGNDKGTYRVSAGYLDQEGILDESGLRKYVGSFNGNYKFFDNDRLKIDINLNASQLSEDIAPVGETAGFTGDVVGQALQWNPTRPLVLANGEYDIELGSTTINPLAMLNATKDKANVSTVLASIASTLKLTEELNYKFQYGINHSTGIREAQILSWINVQNIEGRGWGYYGNNVLTSQNFTHTLNYANNFGDDLDFSALLGYEYQTFDNQGHSFIGRDFLTDDIDYSNIFLNASQGSREFQNFIDPTVKLQSYFARAQFGYQSKYLVYATVRADGSSKFGENNRYGIFPSFAVAWNMTEESFLADGPFDNLKLRVGWGQTGNQEFPAGSAQARYAFGDNGVFTGLENVANPDLKWETSSTLNVGVDFGLFDYKLSGSIDYFYKTTTDLLFNFSTIQPAPAGRYWVNLDGKVINSGVELALSGFLYDSENVSVKLGGNVSFLSNKLEDYVGPTVLTGSLHGQGVSGASVQRLENGQPLNSFYVREWLGLGDDGRDMLTDDGNSMFFLGDPNPDVLLGITASASVYDFDIVMNFSGAFGHQIYNNTSNSVTPITNIGSRNFDASLLEGPIMEASSNTPTPSSRFLESGNFLRLNNLTLGYNIGAISNVIKNARIYVTGQNLFVITGYSGFDPEVNADKAIDGVPSFGIEYTPYPSARTIILGVNVGF